MQPDPGGLKTAALKRPQSLNRYGYTENDPINFTDRTGRWRENYGCHWIWYLEMWDCTDEGQFEDDPLALPVFPRPAKELKGLSGGGASQRPYDKNKLLEKLKKLNPNCVKFYNENITGGYNQLLDSLEKGSYSDTRFIDMTTDAKGSFMSGGNTYVYQNLWDSIGNKDAVAKAFPGHHLILLGQRFISPGFLDSASFGFTYGSLENFRDHTLVHEFLHVYTGKSDKQLVEEWTKKGAKIKDGDLVRWQVDGCPH